MFGVRSHIPYLVRSAIKSHEMKVLTKRKSPQRHAAGIRDNNWNQRPISAAAFGLISLTTCFSLQQLEQLEQSSLALVALTFTVVAAQQAWLSLESLTFLAGLASSAWLATTERTNER